MSETSTNARPASKPPYTQVQYDDEPITVCGHLIEFPHHAAPHDPKYANAGRTSADGQPCNRDCLGSWPCVEREAQRITQHQIATLLRDTRCSRTGGRGYAEWTNPAGGRVRYGYGEDGLWVQVLDPTGNVYAESQRAWFAWAANHV